MTNVVNKIFNCAPSEKTSQDWTYRDGVEAGFLKILSESPRQSELENRVPASFDSDLRRPWWRIGDQGSTGTGVGWAIEAALRYHFVKAGYPEEDLPYSFSVKYLNMAGKDFHGNKRFTNSFLEQSNTRIKVVLDHVRRYGVVRDSDLPYKSPTRYGDGLNSFFIKASNYRLKVYINLGKDPWLWIQWLKNHGPIIARLDVDDSWLASGINGRLTSHSRPYRGGHAVCLVGYRRGEFIIRNSWGTGWGQGGFAFANLGYAMSAITETYGIVGVNMC